MPPFSPQEEVIWAESWGGLQEFKEEELEHLSQVTGKKKRRMMKIDSLNERNKRTEEWTQAMRADWKHAEASASLPPGFPESFAQNKRARFRVLD